MDSLEHIDAFFKGHPSPEEASQFEKRVLEDPAFANEVADYLSALAATREANTLEQKQRFRELYRQQVPKLAEVHKIDPRTRRWLPLAAAAAILIVVAFTWLLSARHADPSKLADQYISQNLTLLPLKMGASDPMQTGISLYNAGQFAKAAQQFEALLRTDSLNPTALINTGIVSLRLGEYDKALDYFTKLQKQVQSVCLNGTWLLYENENFNREEAGGVEYFTGDSFCSNLHSLPNQTSSLRFAGSSLGIGSDSITFYSQPYFQGMEEYFTESASTLDILKNDTRSLIVTGRSDWRLYDQHDFKGDSFCVNPNDTDSSGKSALMITNTNFIYIPHGSVKSLKLGCDEFENNFENAPI